MPARRNCPACGSTNIRVERPSEHHYASCGLSDVILVGRGVEVVDCGQCSSTWTRIANEPQLLQVIGATLLMNAPGMRGEELRYLRTMVGMTQSEMATALGTDRRETIAEWERMDRIWARPSLEIGPRVLLLHLFVSRVLDSDDCVLTESQKDELRGFLRAFVEHIAALLARTRGPRISITHRARKKEWDAGRELALA